jgi:hypothetical protein
MQSEPSYISSMTDGAAQPDGSAVAFVIHTNDGQSHPFACATVDVEKMVSWLIGLGVMADEARRAQGGGGAEAAPKTEIRATPVPVKQVALGAGKGPGEVTVAFSMGLFDLAFNLPQEAVKNLHAALGKTIGG